MKQIDCQIEEQSFIHSGWTLVIGARGRTLNLLTLMLTLAWCLGAQAQRAATAVATVANGSLTGITVTDGGSGYAAPPNVTLVGGGGSGASALAQVSSGVVSVIVVVLPGAGYTEAPVVAVEPPPPPVIPAGLTLGMVAKLTISGPAGEAQKVQYTDALGDTNQWVTLTNIILGDSPSVLIDSSAPVGMRVYRSMALSAPGPDPARWAWVNPGTFTMGSPVTEFDRSPDESPQTQVTFTRGYWIERYEVTQEEYTAVIGTNHSTFNGDTNQPVEQVAWFDAVTYCVRLTLRERAAGRVPAGYEYRLPTEAEWECAARAGTTTRFPFGDDLTYTILPDYAWFAGDSGGAAHDVGGKKPNPWGIYDMSGNVWEWCADWYGPYPGGAVTDPAGASTGTSRVMRGGSWHFAAGDSRPADRNFNVPDFMSFGIGFRVVLGPALP
ncbi:MAG TPA: formylglycine-generating enzyme family protein [Verrucomicrobiae bacterium]